jgi:hypothetical protein
MLVGRGIIFIEMEEEIWKDVIGYEGLYRISKFGDVENIKSGRKLSKGNHGRYWIHTLSKNGITKTYLLHRLLAIHFIDNPLNLPCVLHKDDNGFNNNLDNLMWGTHQENSDDMINKGRARKASIILSDEEKIQIDDMIDNRMVPRYISEKLGISQGKIKEYILWKRGI